MKKTSKLIIGVLAAGLLVVGVQQGLKYYLQGPPRPFNALIVSGEKESVDKAKEIYKDNTKYTKDYKYKIATTDSGKVLDENGNVEVDEDGKELTYEYESLIISKSTAKNMLKDQVLRVKNDPYSGSILTSVLESIPNIDTDKVIYFGNENKEMKVEINGKNMPLEYGSYSWIGYYPSEQGGLIVVDDEMYSSITDNEKDMSLIRFAKGKKDLRNAKDKEEPKQKLLDAKVIEINYANVEK
ncbi:MAG: lipoprotein BA_5634 family protein [Peptostreptococcaceae bacterium]